MNSMTNRCRTMLIGGLNSDDDATSEVFWYNWRTESWSFLDSLDDTRMFPACGVFRDKDNPALDFVVVVGESKGEYGAPTRQ